MANDMDAQPEYRGLEAWLRSPLKRCFMVLVLVVVATVAQALPRIELMEDSGRVYDAQALWGRQFMEWGMWGLIAELVVRSAGWLMVVTRLPILFIIVQIPLSFGIAFAMNETYATAADALLGPPSSAGFGGGGRRPEGRDPNRPGRPGDGAYFGQPGAAQPGARQGRQRPDEAEIERRQRTRFDRILQQRLPWQLFTYWGILGLGAAVASYLSSQNKTREAAALQVRTAHLKVDLAAAQIETLRNQVHPHFLFNALHTVGGLIRQERSATALTTLAGIGELLRSTLAQGEKQEVTLREELRLARHYLGIEGIRFEDRLSVTIEAPEDVQHVMVPALMLLPLVENAIQYGIAPRMDGGTITVRAENRGDHLIVEVYDDGPGFPAEVLENGKNPKSKSGIGLANTRSRLEMLYGDEQRFELSNGPGGSGARVRVEIPRKTENA